MRFGVVAVELPLCDGSAAGIEKDSVMFATGTMYCYFVVFRALFPFIASFAPEAVNFAPDIEVYISFLLHMFLLFLCYVPSHSYL